MKGSQQINLPLPPFSLKWQKPREEKNVISFPAVAKDWAVFRHEGESNMFRQSASQLLKALTRKARESDDLREQIEKLSQKVEQHERLLADFLDVGSPPPLGEYERWIAAGADGEKYLGKHVAYLPGHGVLAAADTIDELFEQVEQMGKVNEVTFGFVPSCGR